MDTLLQKITLLNYIFSYDQLWGLPWRNWAMVISAVVLLVMAIVIVLNQKIKALRIQQEMALQIIRVMQPDKGIDNNLTGILSLVTSILDADGYYFYLFDNKNNSYVLKAVRHRDSSGGTVAPSYSGLMPYQKEQYNPPLSLPASQASDPRIEKQGLVPILVIPVKGGRGLIQAGPVGAVPRQIMKRICFLAEYLQPTLEAVVELEKMKNQVESVTVSSKAISTFTRTAHDLDGSIGAIIGLSIKIVDASAGGFLFEKGNSLEVAGVSGLTAETVEMFKSDAGTHRWLYGLVKDQDYLILDRENSQFYNMPPYLAANGIEMMLMIKISEKSINGMTVFWYQKASPLEQHRIAALQMLTKRMGDTLDRQLKFKELSASYLDMLRILVTAVDNLEPYSVAHSELIARYSGIISRELNLNTSSIQEVMLAGFLHDMGMLGLSGDILFKDGKYNDIEYQTMKLHSDVGASIIDATISNDNVVSYIRHHHERWDGYGYPGGLKGEQIPLGARIIAVADMFNAKLAGRKNREPVSFDKALADLKAAAGTQLDPQVTEALIHWFERKRWRAKVGQALGLCWEIKCCPQNIAQFCPAYQKYDVNCWEVKETKCEAHGSSCFTCMVYTEALGRIGAQKS